MVKIDQHGAQLTVEERVADGLTVPGKLRLESTHFDHQSQQRGDHFFARDYQHVAQRQNPSMKGCTVTGNLWTFGRLALTGSP